MSLKQNKIKYSLHSQKARQSHEIRILLNISENSRTFKNILEWTIKVGAWDQKVGYIYYINLWYTWQIPQCGTEMGYIYYIKFMVQIIGTTMGY